MLVLRVVAAVSLVVGLCGSQSPVFGQASEAKPVPAKADAEPRALDGRDGRDLALDQFRPRSTLHVEEHPLARAKFPVADVHVHPRVRLRDNAEMLEAFVKLMDDQNIAVCVSMDGGLGEKFLEHREHLWTKYQDRWVIFANVDWRGGGDPKQPATWDCLRPDFGRRMAAQLAEAKRQGASGLKVFKSLGLEYRDADGSLLKVDDPRWDPIWEACGSLGLPVLIHTADPPAFFLPIDETNERWEELKRHPEWSFHGPGFPAYADLIAQFLSVVSRHPRTTFIGAHVASSAEDLGQVGRWLEEHPNLNVDIAARIGELGRQPYTARRFFVKYADRIMFGTDGPRVVGRLASHWRFLETEDEYFGYAENPFPPQGFWNIYGVNLPEDVLRKVYNENAARLIPGVKERLEAYVPAESKQPAR